MLAHGQGSAVQDCYIGGYSVVGRKMASVPKRIKAARQPIYRKLQTFLATMVLEHSLNCISQYVEKSTGMHRCLLDVTVCLFLSV